MTDAAKPWSDRERVIYDIGYSDGESSYHADWIFALDEHCDLPEGVEPGPMQVAAYIARLQAALSSGAERGAHARRASGMKGCPDA